MRVPRNHLRSSIIVSDYVATGSRGPVFAPPRTVRASVQSTDKILITDVGEEVTADALVIIRPEDGPVAVESKVYWADQAFRVVKSFPMPDDFRPSHWEITLRRWSA